MGKIKSIGNTILCLLLSLILTLGSGIGVYAESASKAVEVKLLSVMMDSNNHVGNEWYYSATANGKQIYEGDTVILSVKSSSTIKLTATSTEDDSIPDIGRNQLSIPVSKLKSGAVTTYSLRVRVVENRGRYSGNSAIWVFTFSIKAK